MHTWNDCILASLKKWIKLPCQPVGGLENDLKIAVLFQRASVSSIQSLVEMLQELGHLEPRTKHCHKCNHPRWSFHDTATSHHNSAKPQTLRIGMRSATNCTSEKSVKSGVSRFQYSWDQDVLIPFAGHRWHTFSPFQWVFCANFHNFLWNDQSPLSSAHWKRNLCRVSGWPAFRKASPSRFWPKWPSSG